MEKITSHKLGEQYQRLVHSSGLTVLLCPMPAYSTAYALFGTRYGSIDESFKTSLEEQYTTVPAGIAHFLEHKLFENEEGDAFSEYSKTGASANAYTSFDRTAYLFGCTDNFRQSLDILLHLVVNPYFTPSSVEKEQGIIGQEITMYDDNPEWRVYFNLLGALYQNHPIRVDIAGTIESISKINADILYKCYYTFYNLSNMVLSIAGNFQVEEVLEALDKHLKPSEPVIIDRKPVDEPREVAAPRVEQNLQVAVPLFQIGFKGPAGSLHENMVNQTIMEVLVEAIVGEATPLYRKLYDLGLINATFGDEVLGGDSYFTTIFAGESKDPDQINKILLEGIEEFRKNGITEENFERAKRACYGRYIGMYGNVESVASIMMMSEFAGMSAYNILDVFLNMTCEQVNALLQTHLDPQYSALSVIKSK